jgi:hypothetical protein
MKLPLPQTKLLLIPVAGLFCLFIVAMERPASPLKAPFVVTFDQPVSIEGLNSRKLADALQKHPPVAGSRVVYDKVLIFPRRSAPPRGSGATSTDASASDITMAQQTKAAGGGGGETDARHVAQRVGYESAAQMAAFFEALQ